MPARSFVLQMTTAQLEMRARLYVARCVRLETPARVDELARLLGRSPQWLRAAWRERCGGSIAAYLRRAQLAVAMTLLTSTNLNTTRVAYQAGFGTRRTFFRAFQRETEMTPAQWRRRPRVVRRPVRVATAIR